jgi:hypothetical protein
MYSNWFSSENFFELGQNNIWWIPQNKFIFEMEDHNGLFNLNEYNFKWQRWNDLVFKNLFGYNIKSGSGKLQNGLRYSLQTRLGFELED